MTPSREALFRIVAALVADELGARRGGAIDPAESRGWTEATTIDEDGLGVDSLARLELVARVAGFFHMPETGAEDYLLVHRSLGDWAEIVGESLKRYAARVTFQTSGSTGAPKRIAHEWADLDAEAEAAAAALPGVRRVLALAPPHHIYGFLWTVLLPQGRRRGRLRPARPRARRGAPRGGAGRPDRRDAVPLGPRAPLRRRRARRDRADLHRAGRPRASGNPPRPGGSPGMLGDLRDRPRPEASAWGNPP
jgi:Acyl-coenzyme A synthetases/AMP-(fatty) acid ligases